MLRCDPTCASPGTCTGKRGFPVCLNQQNQSGELAVPWDAEDVVSCSDRQAHGTSRPLSPARVVLQARRCAQTTHGLQPQSRPQAQTPGVGQPGTKSGLSYRLCGASKDRVRKGLSRMSRSGGKLRPWSTQTRMQPLPELGCTFHPDHPVIHCPAGAFKLHLSSQTIFQEPPAAFIRLFCCLK